MKLYMDYPDTDEGIEILKRFQYESPLSGLKTVADRADLEAVSDIFKNTFVSEDLYCYIVKIAEGTSSTQVTTNNDVLGKPRVGSALKLDEYHAFPDIVDNYAGLATKTPIKNGTLYQIEGSLNGVQGRFEWIIDSTGKYAGQVSHRYFVPGGTLNGVPIKP